MPVAHELLFNEIVETTIRGWHGADFFNPFIDRPVDREMQKEMRVKLQELTRLRSKIGNTHSIHYWLRDSFGLIQDNPARKILDIDATHIEIIN